MPFFAFRKKEYQIAPRDGSPAPTIARQRVPACSQMGELVGGRPLARGMLLRYIIQRKMKCPHCNTGIHESFSQATIWNAPMVASREGNTVAPPMSWTASFQRCPECHEAIIILIRAYPSFTATEGGRQVGKPSPHPPFAFMVYPASRTRPIPGEVVGPYREDFAEACKVLGDSPNASAALSRRLMQAILRDKAGTTKKDLFDQIEEVVASGHVPTHISEALHAVRNIGNFAAHPMKSTATGVIVDVEPGEAEWNLDVIEMLFDFYFVEPAVAAKRKAELNKKLRDLGKAEIP